MELKNGFWVDENGNTWNEFVYIEEQAIAFSNTLINCFDCRNCSSCRDCLDCFDCFDCFNCSNCSSCRDYIEKPLIYSTKKIGSRNGNTIFYYGTTKDKMSLQVVCGCFRGNLKEFEKAVLKTHKNNEHYKNQYLNEIAKVKVLFELKADD